MHDQISAPFVCGPTVRPADERGADAGIQMLQLASAMCAPSLDNTDDSDNRCVPRS